MIASSLYKAFNSAMISGDLLDDAITWIASNLPPEDVFPTSDLEYWAEDNGYEKGD